MSIGKNITMFRKAKGFTQAELGNFSVFQTRQFLNGSLK